MESYFLVLSTVSYFFTLLTQFFVTSWSLRTLKTWSSIMFIYYRSDSEIIFLLMFSSHYLYLFRRENNLELYIFILLYRRKKGFVNNLPILVNIAHRDHRRGVAGCVRCRVGARLGFEVALISGRQTSGLPGTTSTSYKGIPWWSVLSAGKGWKWFLPW